MLPFCGYHMGDYFEPLARRWGRTRAATRCRKIFYVNWFRKGDDGKFLWPGYGDNSRVLKWIFDRCEGTAKAIETPIGNLPADGDLDLDGLDLDPEDLRELLAVESEGWLAELPMIREYYESFGAKMPKELVAQLDALKSRLES